MTLTGWNNWVSLLPPGNDQEQFPSRRPKFKDVSLPLNRVLRSGHIKLPFLMCISDMKHKD